MKKTLYALIACCFFLAPANAQVKTNFLYHTGMPYGTLDIRTTISSTQYYYLRENETFSYRESSPGVKTKSYRDMTSWESSPYTQGHLRFKNGTTDIFKMNYRLLKPLGYTTSYSAGFPLIVLLHGGVERGNCFYEDCYHATWTYDPNVNSPAAPTSSTHSLLNNDYNLSIGGKQHLDARNLAGSRLPNDPTLAARAFPGFVLVTQMLNDWDGKSVEDMIRIVQLLIKQYKIDPNRVYVHGLSVGGGAVYEALKRGSWLFAAAMPMCATRNGGIFEESQQSRVVNIPLWVFQGGKDPNPTPATTTTLLNKWKSAGAIVKYTEYADLGHAIWNKAYAEADFFKWLLSKNKSNIHVYKGNKVIVRSTSTFPKLYLPQGFFAYQWQRDGVTLSTTSYALTATVAGTYRARFSRVANPTSTQWNKWSATVTVTEGTTASSQDSVVIAMEEIVPEVEESVSVFPNPTNSGNINVRYDKPVAASVKIVDAMGRAVYDRMIDFTFEPTHKLDVTSPVSEGLYYVVINDGTAPVRRKILIRTE
jgi:hypothetical protein